MFPHQLDDPQAFAIAQAIVEGFDRHYRLFSAVARGAKARFEKADWQGQLDAQRERIAFYDLRVDEAVERLHAQFVERDAFALRVELALPVRLLEADRKSVV